MRFRLANSRAEGSTLQIILFVAWILTLLDGGILNAESGERAAAATSAGFTREEAISALRKVDGRFIYDEKKPGKPLTRIRIIAKRVTDADLRYLAPFTDVPWLEIINVNVSDKGLVHLKDLIGVRDLNLESTQISDAGLVHLKGLANLEKLSLINTRITGPGLVHLQELKKLTTLQLSFCELTDAGLEHLKKCHSLEELGLDDTKVSAAGVKALQQALPRCRVLWSPLGVAAVRNPTPMKAGGTLPEQESTSSIIGEWAEWRGPNRDGLCRETGLIQQLPPEGPPLVWVSKRVGWGYSTVAISQGRLFTTGKLSRESPTQLFCCDVKTGKPIWDCTMVKGEEDPFGTPTVDGDLVLALSREGELVCAKVADGSVVWRRNFFRDFGGTYQSFKKGGGYSESVLVDRGHVICTPGGQKAFVVALDRSTGETVWETPLPADFGPQGIDAAGFSSPVISEACGIRQYVQMTGRGLISVAADDGRTLWTHNSIANVFNNVATPIIRGDYVFASTSHGDTYAGTALVKVISDNGKIKAEEVYRLPERTAAGHHGGMVLVGDYVYMGHGYNRGFPLCIEMMTGKVMWRPGRGPGTGSAAVLYADGQIYFTYENGAVAMVEATPTAYVPKGSFMSLPNERNERTHPVVAGGRLYLRGGNWLRCYDINQR